MGNGARYKSKRTGGNPIFLGPTMIHHSKSEATYQMLATTCVRKCSSLTKAKGFIIDGETALQNAFQFHLQLKHSQSLRCFKHFENNCKNKLRDRHKRKGSEVRFVEDAWSSWERGRDHWRSRRQGPAETFEIRPKWSRWTRTTDPW